MPNPRPPLAGLPPLLLLRAFEAAARTSSFTAAAKELNLTQAAISYQVRALEDHLGFALFERKPRGVRLKVFREFQNLLLQPVLQAK